MKEDRENSYAVIVMVMIVFALAVGIVAYKAGKADGRKAACSTGEVYALDYSTVEVARTALARAMDVRTTGGERGYLLGQVAWLLKQVGSEGPLQVVCR